MFTFMLTTIGFIGMVAYLGKVVSATYFDKEDDGDDD